MSNIYQIIASKYDLGANDRAYRLDLRPSNKIGFLVSPDGSTLTNYTLEVAPAPALSPGTWYHLAAVLDTPQRRLSLYFNGDLIGSRSIPESTIHNSSAPFMLGANLENGVPVQFFDGLLDEWRVYRGVLSQSEIRNLMNTLNLTLLPAGTVTPEAMPSDKEGAPGLTE